jgi:4-amino-4-deoxy-L-arabinose transferase-like glycosyltransferase
MESTERFPIERDSHVYLVVFAVAALIFVGCMVSPPSLMDDVDSVQSQIAANMVSSHDWVTARIDGVRYLEKSPMNYWMMAVCYVVFGHHDWAARLPHAMSAVALAVLTAWFAVWALGRKAGLSAGLCMATCIGLFLFTRIQIPDVTLTLAVAFSLFAFSRALDEDEPRPALWSALLAVSLATGLLLKSLIGLIFPVAAALVFLLFTRQFFLARTWQRLRPLRGLLIIVLVALPWHILATLRNPPYFAWTLQSGPGQYHGFLWFFLVNEQLLRYLHLRYPRDYNTLPRTAFWLLHFVWLFPWSVYLGSLGKLSYRPSDRAGRARLLALCWLGFILIFFTFSTTQEYYSMPAYPAFALLLGSAMALEDNWIRRGTRVLAVLAGTAALAALVLLVVVRNAPAGGSITDALSSNPGAYTAALGHIEDLTIESFAYLRWPLALAVLAFLLGFLGTVRSTGLRATLAAVCMMTLLFHAARMALEVFDPLLSSRTLAETVAAAPAGSVILEGHYYPLSSVAFYLNRPVLLLNGRRVNLEYGSNAPDAPRVFLDDAQFRALWLEPNRCYLVAQASSVGHLVDLVGQDHLYVLKSSGGKVALANRPALSVTQPIGEWPHSTAN